MLSDETMNKIITKIVKIPISPDTPIQDKKKQAAIYSKIAKITAYKTLSMSEKLSRIDAILMEYGLKHPIPSDRQNFIFERVSKYMHSHLKLGPQTRILDIGGGNGNFLSYLGETYNIPKNNLVCLEQRYDTATAAFHYPFDNANITYAFWDDPETLKNIGEFDIIICMVVLHHIPDVIINDTIMPFIDSHIVPGGYLLIKEHDARSPQTVQYINWEHHLYYLLEFEHLLTSKEIDAYLSGFVSNYKSAGEFVDIFRENRFKLKSVFNNIFDPQMVGFRNNSPTKLYWALFQRRAAA